MGALVMTRRITREEGIFAGNSAGAAMAGLLQMRTRFSKGDVVVVIFHDHGTRYLAKMFNDDWMREKGFLDKTGLVARDLVASRDRQPMVALDQSDLVTRAMHVMTENDYSQVPVTAEGRIVGSCNFTNVIAGAFQACTLGYSMDARAQGSGRMYEALSATIPHVMQALELHRVMANYQPTNARSGALLRRLGFRIEGYARDYLFVDGAWRDHVLTSFVRENAPPPKPP